MVIVNMASMQQITELEQLVELANQLIRSKLEVMDKQLKRLAPRKVKG